MIGILQSPIDSKTIGFKPSFPWPASKQDLPTSDKAQEVIMTILGLSNNVDGGKVVIGVEKDATFVFSLTWQGDALPLSHI